MTYPFGVFLFLYSKEVASAGSSWGFQAFAGQVFSKPEELKTAVHTQVTGVAMDGLKGERTTG